MEWRQLATLYLFACWHVLLPGHGKSLLAAICVSGGPRIRMFHVAGGYSISHGILMAFSAMSGLLFADRLVVLAGQHGMLIKNLYLPILFVVGLHFALKAYRSVGTPGKDHAVIPDERAALVHRRPFILGLGVGLIPCSDVLGLIAISPMLVQSDHNLLAAGTVVWLGVTTMIMLIATVLWLLPTDRLARHMPNWLAYGVAALICFTVLAHRGWVLWRDYRLLYF